MSVVHPLTVLDVAAAERLLLCLVRRPALRVAARGRARTVGPRRWIVDCRLSSSLMTASIVTFRSPGVVTAPSDAELTVAAYLPSTPRAARRAPDSRRAAPTDRRRRRCAASRRRCVMRRRRATQRDRPAERRLRRDVADHEAVRGAGEASVGHERDVVAEAAADERRGDRQHLAHARAAARPFAADDDDVALRRCDPPAPRRRRPLRRRTRAPGPRERLRVRGRRA